MPSAKTRLLATKRVIPVPQTHHLDSRADQLLAVEADHDADDLLSTLDVAQWLGVSPQWLTIGRQIGRASCRERVSECV